MYFAYPHPCNLHTRIFFVPPKNTTVTYTLRPFCPKNYVIPVSRT
ncbi:unnamed protein product [Chondrus crispus]|uniref:Uncharacterized protein n=1 Tax=Chondrus crispus TaxID=2769 RepID=R7QR10_CHOCR|nr:unnamed protein product [Chondrus crispus]CDF39825.1 unnamed protein product [Chondrus crispus]|eukprot:XP_005710119.1 unnamed protein product [Chondrus crispus]